MDSSSQLHVASPSAAPAVPVSSSVTALASFFASVLSWPQLIDGGHALFNPNNTPLLQPSSVAATAIVSLSHTHQVISLKFTNTNYLYWQMQMKSYLLGQGVFGFVDGLNSCPSSHVLVIDGTSLQVNQSFLCWKQQDQLILSDLLSSLSIEVLHLVVDCQTSSVVKRTLEHTLASTSNSHIMQLHGSLQDL